jgi:subtilisin family serine protease
VEKEKFVILRDRGRMDLADPFSGVALSMESFGSVRGAGLSVEVESLSTRDIHDVRRDPQVVGIAPSMPMTLVAPVESRDVPAAAAAGSAWGVVVTRAAESPYTGKGVTVAVCDTGIDANHEAFKGVDLIQQDFTGDGNGDQQGHGTHCAGTIFGRVIAGYRFSMAPGVQRALIAKVLNNKGSGSTDQIYRGILWALDEGAQVISMSLGMDFPGLVKHWVENMGYPADLATSKALEGYRANVRLFDRIAGLMFARGAMLQTTLVVAAAGNESKRPKYAIAVAPPAAADGFVSVGAVETQGEPHNALKVAFFSNTGPNVVGPGVKIYSAKAGGGYIEHTGTSMATPHVAGIAALWAEKVTVEGGGDAVQFVSRLIGQSSRDRMAPGFDLGDVGSGLVQAPLQ